MKISKYNIILTVLCLILIILNLRACNNKRNQERDFTAVMGTMEKQILKDGTEIARLTQLEAGRKRAIKLLQYSRDSANVALAELIKRGGRRTSGGTVVYITTRDTIKIPVNIIEWDTIYIDNSKVDSLVVLPIYKYLYSDQWQNLSIRAMPDTAIVRSTYHNKLNVRFERKRKYTTVHVRDENPLTSVSSVASWNLERKPRRFGIGIHLGAGIDSELRIRPHAGLSLQYQIIQF